MCDKDNFFLRGGGFLNLTHSLRKTCWRSVASLRDMWSSYYNISLKLSAGWNSNRCSSWFEKSYIRYSLRKFSSSVWSCICMCVNACMCAPACVCVCLCMHIYIYKYTYLYIHIYRSVGLRRRQLQDTHALKRFYCLSLWMKEFVCDSVSVWLCLCVRVCAGTHKYISTYIYNSASVGIARSLHPVPLHWLHTTWYVCVYQSLSVSVCVCLCLSVCLSVSVCVCLCLSVSVCVCPCLSVSVCACESLCLIPFSISYLYVHSPRKSLRHPVPLHCLPRIWYGYVY